MKPTPIKYERSTEMRIIMTQLIAIGAGIGLATSKAVDAIARQPEAEPKIKINLVLGCALAEATAIYGFVIALLIILLLK